MADWAAIFDMDGVIADTNPFHKRAWREFCRAHGKTLGDADMNRHVYGHTNAYIMAHLFGEDDAAARMGELEREKETLFRDLAAGKLPPVAGLPDLLASLKARGAALAVATSAPPENAAFVLAETGLADFFPVVVNSTHASRGKPAPDLYEAAARMLERPPDRCLAFEDSIPGIQSARAAGMTVIGLSTTHDPADLAPLTAMVLPDFREVASPSGVERLAALLANP